MYEVIIQDQKYTGSDIVLRGVYDYCKSKVARIDASLITDLGAVDITIDFPYSNTWEDADIDAKLEELKDACLIKNLRGASVQDDSPFQTSAPKARLTVWQRICKFFSYIFKSLFTK